MATWKTKVSAPNIYIYIYIYIYSVSACVFYVCVCERERERELQTVSHFVSVVTIQLGMCDVTSRFHWVTLQCYHVTCGTTS